MGTIRNTRSSADIRAERRTLRDEMRAWFDGRRAAAEKRVAKARKKAARSAVSRGVDRVPARHRVERPEPQWVHQHQPQVGLFGRRAMTPYVNPARDLKRHARLRAELRSDWVDLTPHLVLPHGTRVMLQALPGGRR